MGEACCQKEPAEHIQKKKTEQGERKEERGREKGENGWVKPNSEGPLFKAGERTPPHYVHLFPVTCLVGGGSANVVQSPPASAAK